APHEVVDGLCRPLDPFDEVASHVQQRHTQAMGFVVADRVIADAAHLVKHGPFDLAHPRVAEPVHLPHWPPALTFGPLLARLWFLLLVAQSQAPDTMTCQARIVKGRKQAARADASGRQRRGPGDGGGEDRRRLWPVHTAPDGLPGT